MSQLFSDREQIRRPPATTEINQQIWNAVLAMVDQRLADGSLGYRFRLNCPDQPVCIGADAAAFHDYIEAHVPGVYHLTNRGALPGTPFILDFIELVAESVGQPILRGHHAFFPHDHIEFDRQAGLTRFVEDINRLFHRAGLQFEMGADGIFRRIGPPLLRQAVQSVHFATGDVRLDELLDEACARIFSRNPEDHRVALEKLWDAFERAKDLEQGANIPARIDALVTRAAGPASPVYRQFLANDATALNEIGNALQIRHHGQRAEALVNGQQVDALFLRMFAFLQFVLSATGRTRS